jgi:hypothetical protein
MADEDLKPLQPVIGALLASGFPFQTAVAHIVQHTPGCTLVTEEFPWQDETGADRFLDLVAQRSFRILAIECRKTRKETLTFLQPGGFISDVNRVRCVYLTQIRDATLRMELLCDDRRLKPKSAESAFCVVSTSYSGKDQRMLEPDAQRIVRATDAYAQHYKQDFKGKQFPDVNRLFLPVIVTNAKLFVAGYDPAADVSLETGELSKRPPATISPVPWVRFRKAFTTQGQHGGDRTVLVVTATELRTFLDTLEEIPTTPSAQLR